MKIPDWMYWIPAMPIRLWVSDPVRRLRRIVRRRVRRSASNVMHVDSCGRVVKHEVTFRESR